MSHWTDLATEVTTADDTYAATSSREAGDRFVSKARALARALDLAASRVSDEMDAADNRAVYAADPHRSRS